MSNVRNFRPTRGNTSSQGSGGGSDWEARLAYLESDIENMKTTLSDVKHDIRWLRNGGIAAIGFLLATIATSYFKLDSKIDSLDSKLDVKLEAIDTRFDRMDEKLSVLDKNIAIIIERLSPQSQTTTPSRPSLPASVDSPLP